MLGSCGRPWPGGRDISRRFTQSDQPRTILRHDSPDPADVEPSSGWCGTSLTVIAGRVIGELGCYVDTDGKITHDAKIDIDGHSDSGPGLRSRAT